MTFENKPGQGALFRNKHKENENQPTMKGTVKDPSGKEWEIAAWGKTTKDGDKMLSIKLSEPYVKQEPQEQDFNDDIPF